MEGFARLAYFIIKYLDKFQIDAGIGLDNVEPYDKPQMWFIPDIGELYQGHERPQLVDQFESDTNKMLDNWKDYGISKLL
jgi:hypothetical protein